MIQAALVLNPTNTRFRVLAMLVALAALTYMDRLCISAAAPAISQEFGFSPSQMGYSFSAFTLSYALFEIPSGWLGDQFGTRRALTRIVLWWSAFTVFTSATVGFTSLLIVRFLFGMGEAGAIPNSAGTVSRWFPISQQGRAMSAVCMGHAIGAAATPPLVFRLIELQGWRLPFIEFGLLGVVWCALWYWWFRDKPEEHSEVNVAELNVIRAGGSGAISHAHPAGVSWKTFVRNRNLLFLCAMYFAYGYSLYFYITWLPTYLLKARNFSTEWAGYFSALPWLFGAMAFLIGGGPRIGSPDAPVI